MGREEEEEEEEGQIALALARQFFLDVPSASFRVAAQKIAFATFSLLPVH